ncbi:hypothetical protein [Paenibacillus kobensis]|uniref:hypothetical protein n=1 Tax=Paenibacillus kobensis TaxID=59841 RepID=UPI000FD828B8|nr:hypothetical protein [Paenibacillus kobensis]
MKYSDESIVEILNEAEKLQSIEHLGEKPIRIGGRYYEFVRKAFLDDKVLLWLPDDFEDMSEQARKVKYPYEERPEIIKSDERGAIAFTLNVIDQELEDDWIQELVEGTKAAFKNMNPGHLFYSEGVDEVHGKKVGYLEFKSPGMDGFLYQIMYFFEYEGRTGMGTFSCPYKEYADWKEVAFRIIRDLVVIQEKEGE